jgi:hypothetical protein
MMRSGFLHLQPILVVTTLLLDPFATALAKAIAKEKVDAEAVDR